MINRKFKKCLITGITGSGGSYLAEYILLKDKNIKIFGIYRSLGNKNLLKNKRIKLIKSDLCNFSKTLKNIKNKSRLDFSSCVNCQCKSFLR